MSDASELLVREIPYLRRYARALTGSQARGDEYVKASLETILQDASPTAIRENPRLELFRTFHDVWARMAPPAFHGPEGDQNSERQSVKRSLAMLPRRERQVFLLHELERFSVEDICTILRSSEDWVAKMLDRARSELADQVQVSILIIEDDPIISMGNAQIVEEMGHRVAGTASTEDEALAQYDATEPDLILADIRLHEGGSGIRVIRDIMKFSSVPVIFVTGHPEDLLTGESVEPTFVIEKPFDPEVLKAAIAQALSFKREQSEAGRRA